MSPVEFLSTDLTSSKCELLPKVSKVFNVKDRECNYKIRDTLNMQRACMTITDVGVRSGTAYQLNSWRTCSIEVQLFATSWSGTRGL